MRFQNASEMLREVKRRSREVAAEAVAAPPVYPLETWLARHGSGLSPRKQAIVDELVERLDSGKPTQPHDVALIEEFFFGEEAPR